MCMYMYIVHNGKNKGKNVPSTVCSVIAIEKKLLSLDIVSSGGYVLRWSYGGGRGRGRGGGRRREREKEGGERGREWERGREGGSGRGGERVSERRGVRGGEGERRRHRSKDRGERREGETVRC